ncbi:MAG TPA: calcium-binding protein [Allosphingosinicella sp.]|jgi:hypothetical protein
MALFIGSDASESIRADFVTASVTSDPPGSFTSDADDVVYAGGGDDSIATVGGDDEVRGGLGDDQAMLGAGNDIFIARHDESNGVDEGFDIVNGGNGFDRYSWSGRVYALEVSISFSAEGLSFGGFYSSGPQERWALLNEIEVFELSGNLRNFSFRELSDHSLKRIELELGAPGSFADSLNFQAGAGDTSLVVNQRESLVTIAGLGPAVRIANMSDDALVLSTGLGDDTVDASTLGDGVARLSIYGGEGSDTLSHGRSAAGVASDLAAAETLEGFGRYFLNSFENLTGSRFGDILLGDEGANRILGGGGNDRLDGRVGADLMNGGAGNDDYFVDDEGDAIFEGEAGGTDEVYSPISYALAANVERLTLGGGDLAGFGNLLNNIIVGGGGDNLLRGGGGGDRLDGLAGNDRLSGGAGLDRLTGGDGNDWFLFETAPASTNADTITDFDGGDDTIFLDRDSFGNIPAGALAADAFVLGTSARDQEDRVIYDAATGRLFFDADGEGGSAAILFARVDAGTELGSGDFRGF